VTYPGFTPVGNATLVVANVLTCNKHSQIREHVPLLPMTRLPLYQDYFPGLQDPECLRHTPAAVAGSCCSFGRPAVPSRHAG
jgi:hypothetical protein